MGRKPSNRAPSKTEAITLRISPKLKYGLELIARQYRRTLSAVVEEYIETGLKNEACPIFLNMDTYEKLIWHPDEVQRFLNLAAWAEHILTYEEQRIFRAIWDTPYFHQAGVKTQDLNNVRNLPHVIDTDKVRKHWDLLNEIASGEKDFTALPKGK